MSFCCFKCFRSPFLRRHIRKHGTKADCDYCGASDVQGLSPRALRELFTPLISLYEPAERGDHFCPHGIRDILDFDPLAYLLDEDWRIFSASLGERSRERLLDDIWIRSGREPDGVYDTPPSEPWASIEDRIWDITPEQTWRWFAEAVKAGQWEDIDTDDTGELVHPRKWVNFSIQHRKAVRTITPKTILYRGRPGHPPLPFPGATLVPWSSGQMHAPPAQRTKHYRVNRAGVRVFYCACEMDTALHESGRTTGAQVSLRRVAATRSLRLADLTKFYGVTEPFGVQDLRSVQRHAKLLQQLNSVLSRPVKESDAELEYLPTQVLADAIQEAGFDGMCFRSSKYQGGTNIVVFNPDDMCVLESDTEACVRVVPPDLASLIAEALAGS